MSPCEDTQDGMDLYDLSYDSSNSRICKNDEAEIEKPEEAEEAEEEKNIPVEKEEIKPKIDTDNEQVVALKPSLDQGVKRKLVDYDDSESSVEENEKNDETSQDSHQAPVAQESAHKTDLPIALRRSRRVHGQNFLELSPTSSTRSKSASQVRTHLYDNNH